MSLSLAVGRNFGLGAPELIVVLVILLVFFSGSVKLVGSAGGARRGSDLRLTPHEKHTLIVLGAVVAVAVGIVIWQRIAQ